MTEDSKRKLEKAVKFLKKAQDISKKPGFSSGGLEYDAALFNLKIGLELLGQIRNDTSIDSHGIFEEAANLRNTLVHNGFEMHGSEPRAVTNSFFNEKLDQLILDVNYIVRNGNGNINNQSSGNLKSFRTVLAKKFTLDDNSSISDYKKKFEFYAQRFADIQFADKGVNDPDAPIKKAAGLDMMVILKEISNKKLVASDPKLLSDNPNYLIGIPFAGELRNDMAHADLEGRNIQSLKEIQDRMKQKKPSNSVASSQPFVVHEAPQSSSSSASSSSSQPAPNAISTKSAQNDQDEKLRKLISEINSLRESNYHDISPETAKDVMRDAKARAGGLAKLLKDETNKEMLIKYEKEEEERRLKERQEEVEDGGGEPANKDAEASKRKR